MVRNITPIVEINSNNTFSYEDLLVKIEDEVKRLRRENDALREGNMRKDMKINDLEGWIMRCEEKDKNSGIIKRKLFEDVLDEEKINNEFMTVESKDIESKHFHEHIDPNSLRYKQAYSNHDFFKHDQII